MVGNDVYWKLCVGIFRLFSWFIFSLSFLNSTFLGPKASIPRRIIHSLELNITRRKFLAKVVRSLVLIPQILLRKSTSLLSVIKVILYNEYVHLETITIQHLPTKTPSPTRRHLRQIHLPRLILPSLYITRGPLPPQPLRALPDPRTHSAARMLPP